MGAQTSIELLTAATPPTAGLSASVLEGLVEHVHEGLREGVRQARQADASLELEETRAVAALLAYALRPVKIETSDLAELALRAIEDGSVLGQTLYILGGSFTRTVSSRSSIRLAPLNHSGTRSMSPPSTHTRHNKSVDFEGANGAKLAAVANVATKAHELASGVRPRQSSGASDDKKKQTAAQKRASAGAHRQAQTTRKRSKDLPGDGQAQDGPSQGRRSGGDKSQSPALKAATLLGDKSLEKQAIEAVGDQAQVNSKVLNMCGEAGKLAPPAARKRLGSEMHLEAKTEQVSAERAQERRASQQAEKERQAAVDQVIHLTAPAPDEGIADHGVDHKAAALLGEKTIEQLALESVGQNAQINTKVMEMVGDANKLAPQPARKRLGSVMSPEAKAEQVRGEIDAHKREEDEAERLRQEHLQRIISMEAPKANQGIADHGVDHKAAALMGEKTIEQRALESVSHNAQINTKVMEMVGDANKLAPQPARKRLGSVMSPEAKAEQVRGEIEARRREEEEAERQRQENLQRVISMEAPAAQEGIADHGIDRKAAALLGDKTIEQRALESVGHHAQINTKVMEMVGDANKLAPQPARKRLGSVMSPEAKSEQVRAELEAKERQKHEEELARQHALDDVLHMGVKESMLKTKGCVHSKAAMVMGDDALARRALEEVGDHAQINKKVLDLLGSAAVASNKAAHMLGDESDTHSHHGIESPRRHKNSSHASHQTHSTHASFSTHSFAR